MSGEIVMGTRGRRGWQAGLGVALLGVVLWLGGCAGTASPAGGSPSPHSLAVATTASPSATAGPLPSGAHIGSNGAITYEPADNPREAISPDPNFDYGFTVLITSAGMRPLQLLAGCCRPVTWKNLTDKTQSVVFDAQLTDSGPIAPGASYVWTPLHPESIVYHSSHDPSLTGQLTIQQMFES